MKLGRRTRGTLAGLVLAVSLLAAAAAFGALSVGAVKSSGPGEVLGIAVQKDGRVVAVGYSGQNMLVQRSAANLSRPSRFKAGRGVASAVVVQPDGKILVAGTTASASQVAGGDVATAANGDMVVKRFNANGSPDRRFGSGGTVRLPGAVAYSLALGPRGTIVAAGFTRGADSTPRVAVARLLKTGKPDKSFGARGFAEIDLGRFSQAYAVAVQRDGRIVFAGDQRPDLRITNALIGRLDSHGRLDRSFAGGGVYYYLHPRGGAASSFRSLRLDGAGRIIAGGIDAESAGDHALVARLARNGSPDRGFGSGGALTTPASLDFNGGNFIAGVYALVITAHGEILAAGRYQFGGASQAAVWALTPRGALDVRIGGGGLLRTPLPASLVGGATSIGIRSNGSGYVGGFRQQFNGPLAGFLIRYTGVPR